MTLGLAERQTDLLDDGPRFCEQAVGTDSVYALLHRERDRLFPDECFADLFTERGRRSIPPSVVATVMVLQRLEGCSDREAVDRFTFDLRWKYAAGVHEHTPGFVHTVLVDMRARLRDSADPDRIFRVTTDLAASAGLLGVRRVLDSAPLYDAVATQDTVTLIRGAIRGTLRACPEELEDEVRSALHRDDDYASAGKPVCDWDDPEARDALIDALVRDGLTALGVLEGRSLPKELEEASKLLAVVVGQDVEQDEDGRFRIARRTAPDRIISVVDPEARHGHKSVSGRFDGYKGHVAVDPDSEIITAAEVGPANGADGELASVLLADLAARSARWPDEPSEEPQRGGTAEVDHEAGEPPIVYGDSAYGSGEQLAHLQGLGAVPMVRVQDPVAPSGRFPKDRFDVDVEGGTVTCPAGVTVELRPLRGGEAHARFGQACRSCLLRSRCTSAKGGRVITVGPHEALLTAARRRQRDPTWQAEYRAHRPKVERKLAHLLRRRHGGRRARMRGRTRVAQDWKLLSAAANLARFARLGLHHVNGSWRLAAAYG